MFATLPFSSMSVKRRLCGSLDAYVDVLGAYMASPNQKNTFFN